MAGIILHLKVVSAGWIGVEPWRLFSPGGNTMSAVNDNDIDGLIAKLEAMSDSPADDEANRRFADSHAAHVAGLLAELKEWRARDSDEKSNGGRVIVEGFDDESMKGAFADALNKASQFFSDHHDIAITVLGMMHLPRGGYRVMVEVDITPLHDRLAPHPEADDVARKRAHEKGFAQLIRHEAVHLKELVHDHFLEHTGATERIPDYFLINFGNVEVLNHMIEHQFFAAGHEKELSPDSQAVIRVRRPEAENK